MTRLSPRRVLRGTVLAALGLFVIISIQSWNGDNALLDPSRLGSEVRDVAGRFGQRREDVAGEIQHRAPAIQLPSYCENLDVHNIAFVTRTGASEAHDKLPPQLSTSLTCVPDPLIFSDLDQAHGPFQIHDVLSRVSKASKVGNPEFDVYRAQKEAAAQGHDDVLKTLAQQPAHHGDWRTEGKGAAWSLDKYKFLHMIDRAWEYQPGKDWYVFIETDTYLSLPNLVKLLATLDPKKKLYLGNAIRMWEHDTPLSFGHGGSGFVLSRATVEEFAVNQKGIPQKYEQRIPMTWFGDFTVADALEEYLHVQITNIFPKLQEHDLRNIPFARDFWCSPVISLHHMTPLDFQSVFDFERSRDFGGLLYRDLFDIGYNHQTLFPSRQAGWDNGASEKAYSIEYAAQSTDGVVDLGPFQQTSAVDPHHSVDACELACILSLECVQYSFYDSAERMESKCSLSKAVRLGKAVPKNDLDAGDLITSGWLDEKIEAFLAEQPSCNRAP